MLIPALHLSFGQLAWALNLGAPPSRAQQHQLRYLRRLHIPFPPGEGSPGRGHRLRYEYEEVIECGVGLYALRLHLKPADVTQLLVTSRDDRRALYRRVLQEQPEAALHAEWVRSRGAVVPLLADEIWLRLHDRYAEAPGRIEMLGPGDLDVPEGFNFFDLVERRQGQEVRGLVPLTRLALQWTAWALEAPAIKPGPKK